MSFPRYERYKDSGVEWLREAPDHWKLSRLKNLFAIRKRIAGEEGFDVLSITQSGIRIKDISTNDGQLAMDYAKYQFVYPGDFAMNHMDLLTGYVDLSSVFGVTSPDYRVFSVKDSTTCYDRYFLRLFQNAYHEKIFYAFGQGAAQLGRWRLPTEGFNDFVAPLPPFDEQVRISRFLDKETAKIDALIGEQRRLIELLKEKRQAVISHAVTKGLNPDAPMKDSGIDWIGDVPSHWIVGKCGFYISLMTGFAFPSDGFLENTDGVRLLRGINVGVGQVRWDETVYWARVDEDGLDEFELRTGDIVLGMDRPVIGGGVRVASITEKDLPCLLLQRVASIRTTGRLSALYLRALLSSPMFVGHFSPETTGVSVPHISPEQIKDFVIPIPPIEEQKEIVAHLEKADASIGDFMWEATSIVTLLEERRSALISAAVTGKIDVRRYVPSQPAVLEEAYEPA